MFPNLRFPRLTSAERRFGADVPVNRRRYSVEEVAEMVDSVETDIYSSEDLLREDTRTSHRSKPSRKKSNNHSINI